MHVPYYLTLLLLINHLFTFPKNNNISCKYFVSIILTLNFFVSLSNRHLHVPACLSTSLPARQSSLAACQLTPAPCASVCTNFHALSSPLAHTSRTDESSHVSSTTLTLSVAFLSLSCAIFPRTLATLAAIDSRGEGKLQLRVCKLSVSL